MKAIPKWNNTERKRGFVGNSSGSWRVKWQVVVVGVKKTGRDIGGIKNFCPKISQFRLPSHTTFYKKTYNDMYALKRKHNISTL